MRRLALPFLLLVLWAAPAGAWTWPVDGPVFQGYSFDPAHPYAGGAHRGIDVGADAGAPVLAPAAGTVSFAGPVPTNGLTLTIDTTDGFAVTLTHLGSLAVARGSAVAEGDAVGTVGPSGTPEVDAPYVHLGVRLGSDPNGYLDPLSLLPDAAPAPGPAPAPVAPPPPAAQPGSGSALAPPAAEQPPAGEPAESPPAGEPAPAEPLPAPVEPAPATAAPSSTEVLPATVVEPAPAPAVPARASTRAGPRARPTTPSADTTRTPAPVRPEPLVDATPSGAMRPSVQVSPRKTPEAAEPESIRSGHAARRTVVARSRPRPVAAAPAGIRRVPGDDARPAPVPSAVPGARLEPRPVTAPVADSVTSEWWVGAAAALALASLAAGAVVLRRRRRRAPEPQSAGPVALAVIEGGERGGPDPGLERLAA